MPCLRKNVRSIPWRLVFPSLRILAEIWTKITCKADLIPTTRHYQCQRSWSLSSALRTNNSTIVIKAQKFAVWTSRRRHSNNYRRASSMCSWPQTTNINFSTVPSPELVISNSQLLAKNSWTIICTLTNIINFSFRRTEQTCLRSESSLQ